MTDLADAPEFKPMPKWLGSGYTSDLSDWQKFLGQLADGSITVGKNPQILDIVAGTTIYSVQATPKYITFNGTTYYHDHGYTYDSTTKQITLDLSPIADDIVVVHFV